jgi:hypothetical protein
MNIHILVGSSQLCWPLSLDPNIVIKLWARNQFLYKDMSFGVYTKIHMTKAHNTQVYDHPLDNYYFAFLSETMSIIVPHFRVEWWCCTAPLIHIILLYPKIGVRHEDLLECLIDSFLFLSQCNLC